MAGSNDPVFLTHSKKIVPVNASAVGRTKMKPKLTRCSSSNDAFDPKQNGHKDLSPKPLEKSPKLSKHPAKRRRKSSTITSTSEDLQFLLEPPGSTASGTVSYLTGQCPGTAIMVVDLHVLVTF